MIHAKNDEDRREHKTWSSSSDFHGIPDEDNTVIYLDSRTQFDVQHFDDVLLVQKKKCFSVDQLNSGKKEMNEVSLCNQMNCLENLLHQRMSVQCLDSLESS